MRIYKGNESSLLLLKIVYQLWSQNLLVKQVLNQNFVPKVLSIRPEKSLPRRPRPPTPWYLISQTILSQTLSRNVALVELVDIGTVRIVWEHSNFSWRRRGIRLRWPHESWGLLKVMLVLGPSTWQLAAFKHRPDNLCLPHRKTRENAPSVLKPNSQTLRSKSRSGRRTVPSFIGDPQKILSKWTLVQWEPRNH